MVRQRLHDLLDELVEKRLVLISAPAGYGKTSLLIDYCCRSQAPICWYAIDQLDYDPYRFISHFAAAIQNRFPAFGQRTASALTGEQGQFDADYVATVLINDLYEHVDEHFLLILDDFHLVNDSLEIRSFISRLLLDMDENCHLLVTSRTLLSLPVLPILAARADVGGISYEELAFLPHEIQQLYAQNRHQDLSIQAAEEVHNQTEGWITGILLASQVNQQDTDAQARLMRVSGFRLEDYFSQVFDSVDENLKTFLLRTSLLEEFNAERCAHIIEPALSLETSPWQNWMDIAQQNNLFVLTTGEKGDWLRYHPLFLDFLQNTIFSKFPDEAYAIEYEIANSSIRSKDWDQAFAIFRKLGSLDKLVELIETAGADLVAGGRISTLSAWLDSLPVEVLHSQPYMVALQGHVAAAVGNSTLALTLYNQSIEAMQLPRDRCILARVLSMRAALHRLMGKLDAAKTDANESLLLIQNDLEMRKTKGEALRCIGLCNFHQGKLHDALAWLEDALNVMLTINDQKNEAIIHLEMGLIYENLGEYASSKEKYTSALTYWKRVENPIWLSNLLNNLGVLQQLMGDYEQASRSFEEAMQYAQASGYARMQAFILTGIGDIYTELQADEQAEQAYRLAFDIAERAQEHFLQVYIHVQSAALAAHRGRIADGYQLIQDALKRVGSEGSEMERQLCELEYAGIRILEGHAEEIITSLENVCTFFEREGHKVQFEKAHLYLLLAYQQCGQNDQIIPHLLNITSCIQGTFPSATLIATALRHKAKLKALQVDYMQEELNQFLLKIIEFEEKLPVLWRYLRSHAKVIPFAPPTIFIRALGRMQVMVNNHIITSSEWQTQAARDLFFMLLVHSEGMTRDEISVIFWPDASPEEARFRFKNTVYRLRRAVGKDCVLLEQDVYRFNDRLDYEYDVELFLKENALANQVQDPMQKLSHFREAIKHYRGDFLNEIDETWAINSRECLKQNYLNILLQVSEIYLDLSNYDLALEYCQRALDEDNLLEEAYRQAFKIFAATGNRAGLVRQYQRCVEVLDKEINAPPSPQTQALYESLLR